MEINREEAQQSKVATPFPHTVSPFTMDSAEQVSWEVMEQIMQLEIERDTRDKSTQVSLASSSVLGATMGRTREVSENPLTGTDVPRDIKGKPRDRQDKLIAVDSHYIDYCLGSRAVYVLEDTEWVNLYFPPPPAHQCIYHNISIVSNNIVIMSTDATLLFSLSTKQWKTLSQMPTSRYCTSAVVIDDKLMVVGGTEDFSDSNVCEILQVTHDRWFTAASLPKSLVKPLITVLASRVFILPCGKLPRVFRTRLLMYDPFINTYTHRARLPSDIRSTYGACLVGVTDMLYLLGCGEGLSWQCNPLTDQWIQLVTPTARYDYGNCCAVVRDNNILLCGGSKVRNEGNIVEEYNTVTQQWKVLDIHLPFQYDDYNCSVFNVSM